MGRITGLTEGLRQWLLLLSLGVMFGLGLSGCGFHLRGAVSSSMDSLAISNADGSAVVQSLLALLKDQPRPRVVEANAAPQVHLIWQSEQRARTAETLGTSGQVLVYRLTLVAQYQVSVQGAEPVAQTAQDSRTMQYSESDALGKQNEEDLIWQSLSESVAAHVLRQMDWLNAHPPARPAPSATSVPAIATTPATPASASRSVLQP